VYRLVCTNTVEERILIRAQQKHAIQSTVYAGGFRWNTAAVRHTCKHVRLGMDRSNMNSSNRKQLAEVSLFFLWHPLQDGGGGRGGGAGAGSGSDKLEIQHLFSESELQSMLQPDEGADASAAAASSADVGLSAATKLLASSSSSPLRASPSPPPPLGPASRPSKHRLAEDGREESALKRQRANGDAPKPQQQQPQQQARLQKAS
jgi:hypothetical protein